MTVRVSLEFNTAEEAIGALGVIAGLAEGKPASSGVAGHTNAKAQGPAKNPRGKGKSTAKDDKGENEPEATQAPAAPVPTLADCTKVIEQLFNAKGPQAALDVLQSFKVQRCQELPEDKRAAFLEAATKAAA